MTLAVYGHTLGVITGVRERECVYERVRERGRGGRERERETAKSVVGVVDGVCCWVAERK